MNGDFKLCGVVMGMLILQGGPAPNFMDTSIASYLVGAILQPKDNKSKCYQTLCESVSIYGNFFSTVYMLQGF